MCTKRASTPALLKHELGYLVLHLLASHSALIDALTNPDGQGDSLVGRLVALRGGQRGERSEAAIAEEWGERGAGV